MAGTEALAAPLPMRSPVGSRAGTTFGLLLLVFLLSGVSGLIYQVLWQRQLALVFGVSAYATATVLAAFMGGLALGGYVAGRVADRVRSPLAWYGIVEIPIGMAGLLTLPAFAALQGVYPPLYQAIGGSVLAPVIRFGVAFAVLLVPTALMGASFPLIVKAALGSRDDGGRAIGLLYAINTLGAVVGTLAAGFVLIGEIGIRGSIGTAAALNMAAGLVALLAARRFAPASPGTQADDETASDSASAAAPAAPSATSTVACPPALVRLLPALLALAADGPTMARTRLASAVAVLAVVGLLGALAPRAYADLLVARFPGEEILWSEEGLETTVTITRDEDGHLAMYLNHHHQANDADWMVFFHRMLGHLPMLLHPGPKQVLVVGLGGGATAGATTRYEGAQVTVVELSRSVVRGAAWFREVNYAVEERPNLTMLIDDGRNHLLVSGRTYDVITADAMFPTQAGSTNLYSVEYYQLARRSLNPGGLMLQWDNRRDLSAFEQKLLMRSFRQVFPHVSLWFDGSLLVGSDRPLDPALPWVDHVFEQPIARAALSQVNLRSGDDVRKLYLGERADIEAYAGDGPVISDDRPRLEYFLGNRSFAGAGHTMNRGLDGRP